MPATLTRRMRSSPSTADRPDEALLHVSGAPTERQRQRESGVEAGECSQPRGRARRGCACCDCRKVVARLLCGGVWLGSGSAPQALPQRCSRRRPFTCCVRQRFRLVDGELELRLKACDHYQTYQQSHQPGGGSAVLAPRYKFEMRLRAGPNGVSGSTAAVVVGNVQLRLGHGEDLERYAGAPH